MTPRNTFFKALRKVRKARGLTQEDFATVSSRTYLSSLERGQKHPTLGKVDALSEVLGVHPLTVLALAYLKTASPEEVDRLLEKVRAELAGV
jgi:transcriptional regulator with XRE-family HTH domain